MTQGELYKKIDTLRSLKTTNITKKDTANTGPLNFSKKRFRRATHPIAHIEIEKILDEAKKDYPKHLFEKNTIGEFTALISGEVEEILDWYIKWFGDDEP